jgi:hypothetical protein
MLCMYKRLITHLELLLILFAPISKGYNVFERREGASFIEDRMMQQKIKIELATAINMQEDRSQFDSIK